MTTTTSAIRNIAEAELPDKRIEIAVRAASDKKATNIVILDLRELASFTDFFVICTGRANRQVQAITNEIEEKLRLQANARALHTEGFQVAEWVLMDYGDFIVHIFDDQSRAFYDLERLWRDARRIELHEEQ